MDGSQDVPRTTAGLRNALDRLWDQCALAPRLREAFLDGDPSVLAPLCDALEEEPTAARLAATSLVFGHAVPGGPGNVPARAREFAAQLDRLGARGHPDERRRFVSSVLRLRAKSHPGVPIKAYVGSLNRAILLFEDAAEELLDHLAAVEPPQVAMAEVSKRTGYEVFRRRLNLRFHGFVAAAVTLGDYSRETTKLATEPLRNELQRTVKEAFVEDPRARFLKELRNLVLHERDAPLRASLRFRPHRGVIVLPVEELRPLREWRGTAEDFLNMAGAEIDLGELVRDYSAHALDKAQHVSFQVHTARGDLIEEVTNAEEAARTAEVNAAKQAIRDHR